MKALKPPLALPIRRQELLFPREAPLEIRYVSFLNPRHVPYLNMHVELEFGVCLKGSVRRFVGSAYRDCGPGDVWFAGSWEPHGSSVLDAPCEALIIMMAPSVITEVHFPEASGMRWLQPFTAPPEERPQTHAPQREEVMDVARRVGRCALRQGNWQVRARLAILELLNVVLEAMAPPKTARNDTQNIYRRVEPALTMVPNADHLITVQEAAAACGMSRSTFVRHFEDLMGVSFAQYALRHRFGSAARDLVETLDPIKAIALRWGFTDSSHLYRVFQRFAGCSPVEYRERMRQTGPA